MERLFHYRGTEHADASRSKHVTGTMHIFNLSLCKEPRDMLYTEDMCAQPYAPLFVMPRVIKKEVDPEMYAIIGASHDLFIETKVEKDGNTILKVGLAQEKMRKSMDLTNGKDPNNGDEYEISHIELTGEYTQLTIPENNFCSGDSIKIGKQIYSIITKTEMNIYIKKLQNEEITIMKNIGKAQLYFGDGEIIDDDCEENSNKIKFVGIIGHTQPQQYQFFCGQISIATIIRGPIQVQMTNEEAEQFIPGDLVYMHLIPISSLSEDFKIHYSVKSKITDTRFSCLLGLFITQKAHKIGMLGYICLLDHKPPSFEL